MNYLNMFGGVTGFAFIGVIAGFWNQVKEFIHKIISLVIVNVHVEHDLASAVKVYIWQNFKRTPWGDKRFCSFHDFVKPLGKHVLIAYESISKDSMLFWDGYRPLSIKLQSAPNNNDSPPVLQITFIRGLFTVDELLIRCVNAYNAIEIEEATKLKGRFYVKRVIGREKIERGNSSSSPDAPVRYTKSMDSDSVGATYKKERRILKWQSEDIGDLVHEEPLKVLAFPPHVEDYINELRKWIASEKWFKQKQIPWKRGWLLYGSPGTGKTSLVRAAGEELDLPIYVYDISTLSNEEFIVGWDEMLCHSPCIALIEDIDNVFHGRENVQDKDAHLSFDCLLNCISGVKPAEGIFTVITTNDISKIDPALGQIDKSMSSRPGRIDRVINLGALTKECRMKIAQRILSDCPQHIDELVTLGDGDTGAQFQERCGQVALKHYWESSEE